MRTGPPPYEVADAKSMAELAEPLRSRFNQAAADCKRLTGQTLYVNSGRRTDYQQFQLRLGRVPAGQEWNPAYRGTPMTAIPGRSNHRNLGLVAGKMIAAVDAAGTGMAWLHQHAAEYGLGFPLLHASFPEPWHVEPAGTPTVPITPFYVQEDDDMPYTEAELKKIVGAEVNRVLEPALIALAEQRDADRAERARDEQSRKELEKAIIEGRDQTKKILAAITTSGGR